MSSPDPERLPARREMKPLREIRGIAPDRLIVTDPPSTATISKLFRQIGDPTETGWTMRPVMVAGSRLEKYLILDGNNRAYLAAEGGVPIFALVVESEKDIDIILELEHRHEIPSFPHGDFLERRRSFRQLVALAEGWAKAYGWLSVAQILTMGDRIDTLRPDESMVDMLEAAMLPGGKAWKKRSGYASGVVAKEKPHERVALGWPCLVVYDRESRHFLPVRREDLSAAKQTGYQLVTILDPSEVLAGIRWAGEHQVEPAIEELLNKVVPDRAARIGSLTEVQTGDVEEAPSPIAGRTESWQDETIFIPYSARGYTLDTLRISTDLQTLLDLKGYRVLGDLHGLRCAELHEPDGSCVATLLEMQTLVEGVQHQEPLCNQEHRNATPHETEADACLDVPLEAHQLTPYDFPLSVRASNVLLSLYIKRLGELHGLPLHDLLHLPNCGKKTVGELVRLLERIRAGEFDLGCGGFSPSRCGELTGLLDRVLERLPKRDREPLLMRLGKAEGRVLTLEEIASSHGLTRERVRQIVGKALTAVRKEGGPGLAVRLRGITQTCLASVVPLTPALLSFWVSSSSGTLRLPAVVYVRLLGELDPALPAWPRGQEFSGGSEGSARRAISALETDLLAAPRDLTTRAAFDGLLACTESTELDASTFLEGLKGSRNLRVDFSKPDEPIVRLRRVPLAAVAKVVLAASDVPLTDVEILARASALFGGEPVCRGPASLVGALTPQGGFYLLGPRTYGLRKHFSLPRDQWQAARKDMATFLRRKGRPVSTAEAINEGAFPWAGATNAQELAQVLRE